MKKLLFFALLVWGGCTHDGPARPAAGKRLVRISLDNRTESTYTYENERLSVHRYFGFCTETPADETFYTYDGQGRLASMTFKIGSIYSSTTAICDPARKMTTTRSFSHDAQGRIASFKSTSSEVFFRYDAAGHPAELTLKDANGLTKIATYHYDSRGNLVHSTCLLYPSPSPRD